MSEIAMGTLYDMNKIAMANMVPLGQNEIEKRFRRIARKMDVNKDYALLCRERYDFTVFRVTQPHKFVQEIIEVLLSRGQILDIDFQIKDSTYEIWIKDFNDEIIMYKFFKCDWVIDC